MNEDDIRAASDGVGEALVAGDVERVIAMLSDELKRNLGEVVAMLPLPATEATVQSVDRGGSGFAVVMAVVGPAEEVELQLRWKDRSGQPRIVEVSHLSRKEREPEPIEGEGLEGELGVADERRGPGTTHEPGAPAEQPETAERQPA